MKCSLLTLSCYVDGELEDRRRGEMEAHLVGCARCRSGLGHIREEVERIGALAPVRVVDESAHALLVQLGLIELDDELPERGAPLDDRTATLPPWLQGQASAALPWRPERPVRSAPAVPPPDEGHVELTGPPAAHRRLSALDGAATVPFDLTVLAHDSRVPLMPRSTAGAPMVEFETRKPLEWIPPPATDAPDASVPAEHKASTPAEPEAAAPARPAPSSSAEPEASALAASTASAPHQIEPPPAPPVNPTPALAAAPPAPAAQRGHTWGRAALPPLDPQSPPASDAGGASAPAPPAAPAGAAASEPADATHNAAPPAAVASHAAPPPAGDSAVAVWTSDPADAPPGAEYPITDDDVLAEPLAVERFAPRAPAPAPRPSLVDRLRERLALRKAMSGVVEDEPVGSDIEIVSGTGAPIRARGRSDLAWRRAEALRPAAAAGADELATSRRAPGVREMLPPPARPMSTMTVDFPEAPTAAPPLMPAQPAPPPAAGPARGTPAPSDLREVSGRAVIPPRPRHPDSARAWEVPQPEPTGPAAEAAPEPAERMPRRSGAASTARSGQRVAIAYAAAIAVIGAVGILSGRVSTHIPGATTPGTAQSIPAAPPANSSSVGPSGGSSSASSSQASQAGPASLAPAAPAPGSPSSIGTGGSGWTVQGIRVGDHGTYYRMVFDLGGTGATGEPRVDLTYPDAKTLLITITGASGSAAPPTIGSSSIVTAITPGTGASGTAVYRVTLSKPGTGKPIYLGGPLRLVIDVTAS